MDACNRIKQLAQQAPSNTDPNSLIEDVIAFAEDYFAEDVATNKVPMECVYDNGMCV